MKEDDSNENGQRIFGRLPDGREATLFTFTNRQGASVSITDFGILVF